MKSILQSFIFLFLFLIGTADLWGQCSITSATVSAVSCQSHSTDSPDDDAVQFNLNVAATSGSTQGFWIDVSGGTTVSPQEGTYGSTFAVVLGNGTAGSGSSYTLTLTDKSDLSCQRTVVVGPQGSCSAGCSTPVQFICDTPGNPGPQSITLTATGGLTNVQWYNEADVNIGSGQLVVTTLTPGMSDGSEIFRYEATDGSGCLVSLCCPITVQTQDCGYLDLALIKQKSDNLPVSIGQTVTFNIQVCNQGTDPVTSVSLIDYVPSGFTFSPNNGWTASGSNAIRTLTSGSGLPAAGLAVNTCVTVPLQLVVNSTINTTNVLNVAEITVGTDSRGRTDDIDSTPDSTPTNDAGESVGTPSDNVLTGDGTGTPNGTDPVTDEDDHDPATVRIVDLALIKEIVTPGPYAYGQPITFRITVENQGNETATNIVVSDYVPAGFTFTSNNGWIGSAPLITRTIGGPLAPGATTTIDLVLTPQASSVADAWLNKAEISAFNDAAGNPIGQYDIDSDPNQDPNDDAGGLPESPADNYLGGDGTGTPNSGTDTTDEDDHDPALVEIFDLALTKLLTTSAPYTYGQTHSYTITVVNQGNVTATDIAVNDYIPQGYSFAPNNGWTGGPSTIGNIISGPLAPGASATLTLDLTFESVSASTSPKTWVNYAEIASAEDESGNPAFDADSTPGSNGTNENNVLPNGPGDNDTASTSDTGVGSQDDHDPAGPKVFDLALRKTKETALPSFSYGQTIMYKIEVFNQGNIPATNVEITDYLPCGLEFDASSVTNTGWALSGNKVTKTFTGTLNPGQSTSIFLDLIARECYTNPDNAWTNYAEISMADDTDPNTVAMPTDIDSTPDGTNGNDPGGVPNFGNYTSGTDDTIDNENGDEDDHDPVKIEIFDLALRKVLTTNAPYSVGQTLTFNVEIHNQGNVTATNMVVSDYIPVGYDFDDNNGWTGGPTVASVTIAGPLAPGASVTVPLELILLQNGGGAGAWDNYAEITSSQDDRGNNRNDDADSVSDNNPGNDNPVQPGDPDDNNIMGGGPNASEDEDDHDPAAPQIVDIALRKTTVTTGPYTYGDVVSFNVEVINQGNVDLSDIDVVDYIPCGFEYVSGSQTWVLNGAQAQTNLPGVLVAGTSTIIRIDLRVKPCSTPNAWLNYAEVRNMEDTNGNTMNNADIDSTPDNTNGNDDGGSPESPNDDFVDGNGKDPGGSPGDTGTNIDEDDHDPELISVFDLALRKTLATAGPFTYGQPMTFNIEVINQGNTTARNIVISDYIPSGYSFSGALNPTWSGAAPTVTTTIAGPLAAGASTTVSIVLNLEMSADVNAWDNFAEITTATDNNGNPVTDADSTPDGNPSNDPGGQIESPADDFVNGNGTGTVGDGVPSTDEDDHDGSRPRIVDIALRKTKNPATPGPFRYGDIVSFDIQLTNQGNVTLYDVDVVDYIPCGFSYVSGSQPWSVSGTQASTVCVGSLVPGQTKTLRIDMRVQMCNGANPWTNYAEVRAMEDSNGTNIGSEDIDSTPDSNNTNDPGGMPESPADDFIDGNGTGSVGDGVAATDEDDHDPEFVQVFDLALRKSLSTGAPYTYGQNHVYTIEVFNQGNVNAYDIEVQDYIPAGYSFNGAVNPGWTLTGTTASYVISGPLAPNASTTVQISLTYTMTNGGVRDWINYAEIGSADDDQVPSNTPPTDADSTPDSNTPSENAVTPGSPNDNVITGGGTNTGEDEDDHDPAGPSFYDVALRKTTTATGPFSYGQIVKFDIEVINQGNLPVRNVRVIDYIPSGFTGSAIASNFPTWTFGPTSATTIIPATLQPGQSTMVSIYLQVVPTTNAVSGWDNYAEVYQFEDTSGNNVGNDDVDSTPDTTPTNDPGGQPYSPADDFVDGNGTGTPGDGAPSTDEDDHDPERIEIIDLALRKSLVTAGPYAYGDLLQFNIEVFNQGNEPMRNTQITDYIPAGFTFNLADNPGWTGAAPNPTYVIAGPLLPGASQMITTYLRVQQTTGGEKDWINYAEITDTYNSNLEPRNTWDIDSNPASNGTAENAVEPGDPADNNITSQDKGGEEDDHDPAGIEIFDLALFMINDTDILEDYGDNVVQTITVSNQGSIASDGFDVTVYVPEGYTFSTTSNPGWTDNVNGTVTYVSSEYLEPAQSVQYTLNLTAVPTKKEDGWLVYAEISKDNSVDPSVTTDIDSRPDATRNNDSGGAVNTTSDNVITGIGRDRNGNMTSTFQSTGANTDEDDHDPTVIRVFDMALYKQLVTAGPYQYGDTHEFKVCVVNQGNQVMQDIQITDYLPTGYTFNTGANTGWSVSGSNLVRTIAGPVDVCDTICVSLFLDFNMTTGGVNNWINYSEITSMEDNTGTVREDVDSTPGSDGPDERDVYPSDPADDNTTSTDEGGEEDDHDPAGPKVFDLALFMVDDTDILEDYGDDVTHTITVTNQGNIASNGFTITDYIPAGFKINAADNPDWINNGDGTVSFVSTELLEPGETVQYTLILEAQPTKVPNGWVNYAEISDDNSVDPLATVDIDSRPDVTKTNDAGGAVNTASDDVVTGVGVDKTGTVTAPFGSTNPATDEDDHDPTMIRVYDMALFKSLKTAGPYKYGQVLDFDVCVVNQGNQVMTDVAVVDYLPAGFEYVAANNTSGAWTVSGSNLTANIAGPIAVCDTVCLPLRLTVRQTTGGEKDWINYAEITGMEDENGTPQDDVDSTPSSDGPDERAVEPNDPADDDTTSIDEGGEEDDHDPAGIEVYDLAQRKVTVAQGPFKYGDIVKFTYEVFNQGSIQASDIQVTDYIPCGFQYVQASNDILGWTYDISSGNATVTLPNALVPGASTSIDIYLQVKPCIENSTDAWTNIGEITGGDSDDPNEPPTDIDSDPDDDPTNDPGGEPDGPNDDVVDEDPDLPGDDDEDDQDPERIEVVDLALRKVMVTQGPYSYGQTIDFNIELFNQGNVTMTNIEVVDYIPQGFDFDPALNPDWQGTYPSVYTIVSGPLAPEASTVVSIKLKLVQTTGGPSVYTNGSEITGMDDENGVPRDDDDADSTPDMDPDNDNPVTPGDPNDDVVDESPNDPNTPSDDDEDDSDPAGPKIFDLALRKTQQTALPSFSYGQTVAYQIEIFNQGNIDAKDVVLVDTLPCGLEFISDSPVNAGWVYNPATREAKMTYPNVVIAGTLARVSIETKVVPCYENVATAWTNWVEIESADDTDPNTPNPPTDIDSDPDGDNTNDEGGQPNTPEDDEINGDPGNPNNPDAHQDEDDHDPHQIEVFDLALRKVVDDRGPYMIGETATFRLKVYNQGNVPAVNIVLNDYVRSGFSFNPATNPGWTLTTAATSSNEGLLNYTVSSRLMPGDSIIVPLNLEITLDENPNVLDWWNYGEIGTAQDTLGNNRFDDADSTPNSDTPRENEVEPDGPWDNVIDGNGPNFNEDEDDHDPEKVIVVGGLGDTVWKDIDGDGIQEPGEPGVEGVIATLTDCEGNVLATQVTDANGFYFFNNLIPGNYQVHFDISALPKGCAFTYQNVGGDDEIDSDVNLEGYGPCTYITGGEFDSTYDAGLLILAAIGDYVWHDLNGDGLQTPGEPGIPGVQVNLYKGDGTFVSYMFTDNNGYYLFDFLYPGDYYLKFTAPQGMDLTFYNRGDDAKDSDVDGTHGEGTTPTTTLSPAERDMTWDAGYYFCIPIGDLVWYDINMNDVWNTNENGINGLRVNLWRNHWGTWVIWDYTLTGHKPDTPSDDGYWKFCAPPGEYYVEVIMPPLGLVRARPNIGSIEEIDSDITNANGLTTTNKFSVLSGQEKCDLGAGFYPQAQVGNLVWNDTNANGIQEASEPIVSGVLVQAVVAATGEVMSESVTDIDGTYKLENIEKADVYIRFAPPAGYGATVARVTDDTRDSDVDHSYGANTTRLLSMQPSMENFNIDMGVVFGVLPVDWLDVSAVRENDTHIVSWSTARETNVSHYVVERKLDGQNDFEALPEKVEAKGNTNLNTHYNKVDVDVAKLGVYVYRVKQVDFDGKFTYSPLARVIHIGETSIGLYPNPARTSTSLEVTLSDDAEIKIEIYDAASKLVRVIETPAKTKAGYHVFPIDIESIPVGVYNVIVNINGVDTTKKLIRIE
ncbi:MAG: SdrD B-like domain-containing protein [Saprospiraceae bacterium]